MGTRFLPASKAVPKVLLPVVDRPLIQYAVEEVVRAGISEVCIVVSPGHEHVARHFSQDPDLEAALEGSGKSDLLEIVRGLSSLAEVVTVVQDKPLGLGDAVGVAREFVGEHPFVVALPDEIYDAAGGVLEKMLSAFEERGEAVIAVTEVSSEEISLYGSIDPESEGELTKVRSVVEKPSRESAPSNLAVIGRYVFTAEIFDHIDRASPGAGGEIQITDAINSLAIADAVWALRYSGRRWDCGRKDTYLQAIVALAAERDDLGPGFREFLSSLINE